MKFSIKHCKKIIVFLLITSSPTILFAQQSNKKVTVQGKGLALSKVLDQVERQTDLSFAYNQSQFNTSKTIDIDVINQPLDQALYSILGKTGFTYKIEGTNIIILQEQEKQAPTAVSQTQKRTGKVVDENNQPVIGASVVIRGTTTGTMTDVDGNFSIDTDDNAILAVSCIGYASETIHVAKQKHLNIILAEDSQKLDEVVVVGYNTVKRGQLTGALKFVEGKELEFLSSPILENRLQGRVAGVMIASGSGQPGSDNLSIRIRGTGSINGSNTPLYIMDGVMVEPGQFASLNANDIADIQVLKDASSTAIYGSRGANGVVVITTKSGASGKTQFNYRNQFGYSLVTDYIDMMNSEQNIEYQSKAVQSDPFSKQFPLMEILSREAAGTATAADKERLARARATDTDWIKEMTQTGMLMEHSLSAAGGNDKTKFYLSGSYLDQQGILNKSGLKRYSGRFNIDHTANRLISFGAKMTVGYSEIDFSDPEGTSSRNSWNNPWFTALLAYPYESPTNWFNKDNPALITKYYDRRQNRLKAVWSTYAKVNILDWLSARTNFGMDYMNNRSQTTLDRAHPNAASNKGYFTQNNREDARYTWTNTLNMARDFSNGHTISAVVGMEMFQSSYYRSNFTGYDLDSNMKDTPAGIGDPKGTSSNPPTIGGGRSKNNLISYFTQVGYSIGKQYNLSASLRHDTSSKFVGSNKSAVFWSLGGAWNLNEEKFLKDVSWLNQLKVRASYGTNGNQDGVPDFGTSDGYRPFDSGTNILYSYNGTVGYGQTQAGNPDLKWETSQQTNLGFDISVFSQRLNATVDVYYKKTKDLFMDKKISATSGFTSITTNAGSIANKGIEISLNGTIVRTKDFFWDLGANLTYNKSKILDLGTWANSEGKYQNGDLLFQEGIALGTWSMVEWAGVNPATGNPWFYDGNGNKTENINDAPKVTNFKSYEVPIFGGFQTTVGYKGITLLAEFTYALDYYVMNASRWYLDNHYFNGNKPVKMLDMWMKPGDVTNIPRFGGSENPSPWASQFLEDASYLRLRTLRVNYMLPKSLISKTNFFSNVSIYAQAENLHTWTSYTGADPEVNGNGGQDVLAFPKPRNFTFGFDFNF